MLTVSQTEFRNNFATQGGNIYNAGTLNLEDGVEFDINGGGISKFTSNTSQSTGGYTAIHINATGWWIITDKNQKQHPSLIRLQKERTDDSSCRSD